LCRRHRSQTQSHPSARIGESPPSPCLRRLSSGGSNRGRRWRPTRADHGSLFRFRCVFLAALYRAEREIAEKLKTLAAGKPPWPAIDVDKGFPWVEQRTKLALAESQKAALRVTLVSNVTVITVGPASGKPRLSTHC
jgi:ATP-dependent exoDNAse (exonuclease V) alpha subunit